MLWWPVGILRKFYMICFGYSRRSRPKRFEYRRVSIPVLLRLSSGGTGGGQLLTTGLPASLCHELAGRDPQYIQQVSGAALRSALERLNRPEIYFKTETEHGANGVGAVSG
jgi:hypothetical protein